MKKVLLIIGLILLLVVVALVWFLKRDSSNPYQTVNWGRFAGQFDNGEKPSDNYGVDYPGCDFGVPKEEIPTFSKIDFPFSNKFDNKKSLPVMATAMIDVDNDGVDEVFVSGGVNQEDELFKYTSEGFVKVGNIFNLPKKPNGKTTYGASSFDLDSDGRTDILVSGNYGLYWYKNTKNGFEAIDLNAPLNDQSSALTTTVGDFNRDGHPDIFLSAYLKVEQIEGFTIFKDFSYGASSLLLQNNGDNTFSDVTEEMGLSYIHNTFQAIFTDLDNDSYLDLVVAYDTGEARTYKNEGGTSFTLKPNPTTGKYAYPMGIAIGDYNNDGLVDLFFSNTGSSVPTFLARGDLEDGDEFNGKWILFKNNGNFNFTDVAKEAKVADFEFSWGALFEDFNLDGKQDLVVAENYVDFPPHKIFKLRGRFLVQRDNGQFAAVEEQAGANNKFYGISPITSDFNQDGYPDLLYSNIDGPIRAFINNGGDNKYVAFRFMEQNKNAGAHINMTLNDGSTLSDVYVIGEGLGSDQTSTVTFGLGKDQSPKSVTITFANGEKQTIDSVLTNHVHLIK